MSLPKRDGVNGRYYLIHKPDADAFSQLVLDEQFAGRRGKRSKATVDLRRDGTVSRFPALFAALEAGSERGQCAER